MAVFISLCPLEVTFAEKGGGYLTDLLADTLSLCLQQITRQASQLMEGTGASVNTLADRGDHEAHTPNFMSLTGV